VDPGFLKEGGEVNSRQNAGTRGIWGGMSPQEKFLNRC